MPDSAKTALCLLALSVVSLVQQPGRVSFDTKLDLTVNPVAFLIRSLHLWNPEATSGELQNQAYGYLFPIGPFFAAGQLLGIPAWLTQGVWSALLLCGAFLSALLLTRALRIGVGAGQYLAALGYALAPRMLTEIGPLSAEMMPTVLLPWVLLPLVRAERTGSVRRAAGLSALAVLCMGGTNASMVVMALVLPGSWLLTRRWDRRHLRMVLAWSAAVLAATLWWIVPLLLLGRYSPPFLDYIESAENTTGPVSLFQALRGTTQWVSHVVQGGQPWWPQGWELVDNPVLMAATAGMAGMGVIGLALRGLPHRRFLVPAALIGLTLLTIGHGGQLDSPFSATVRTWLDGPLAPLRNVHKFDPVLRLALMLGFAHAAALLWRLPRGRRAAKTLTAVLVVAVAAPAWTLSLRPGPAWTAVPGYWTQAADWLRERQQTGRTLLLPATGFGQYTWGFTVDEPIQALGGVRWSLRNQIPLGSAGNTRLLDTVQQVLDSGRGSPALAALLARSGYRYLLMRNDIDRARTGGAPAAVQRASLTRSPGITVAASFGPTVRPVPDANGDRPLDQLTDARPALEVFQIARSDTAVAMVDTADVPTVSGGPESLLPLLEQGVIRADQAVVLAGDGDIGGGSIVTDGLRRAERNFGRTSDSLSQTLTAEEPARQTRAARDVLPFDDRQHATVAQYTGITGVTASSGVSFADAAGPVDPAYQPYAAVDGDDTTSWRSSSFSGPVGQWLQVDLERPTPVREVRLRFADDLRVGWPVAKARITTDAGSTDIRVPATGESTTYPVVAGDTRTVRVTVTGMAGGRRDGQVGIHTLAVAEVDAGRSLRVPADQPERPDRPSTFAFSRAGSRPACLTADGRRRCDGGLLRAGEEPSGIDRRFVTNGSAAYRLSATVLPRIGGASPTTPAGLAAAASSVLADDPAAGAGAAVDGNPQTAWLAEPGQLQPSLTLSWSRPRRIDRLQVTAADHPGTSVPAAVELRSSAGNRRVDLSTGGAAEIEPLTTDRVEVVVTATRARQPDEDTLAPTGIAELRLGGVPGLGVTPETFTVECGSGPDVLVDDRRYRTAVSGRTADLQAGRPMTVKFCGVAAGGIRLSAGEHRLRTLPSAHFAVQDLVLRPDTALGTAVGTGVGGRSADAQATQQRTVSVGRWGTVERAVQVGAGPRSLLVVPENANAGWQAALDGVPLARTRVDGWQQAWIVPAGTGGSVTLRFTPDEPYRVGLAAGALVILLLVLAVATPIRRRGRHGRPRQQKAGRQAARNPPRRSSRKGGPGAGDGRPVAWPVYGRPIAWPVSRAPLARRTGLALLVLVLFALGGLTAVVALLAVLVLRELWWEGPLLVAAAGVGTAAVVAVAGRLNGHGQQWADGAWAQGAVIVAAAALVATFAGALPAGRHVKRTVIE